MSVPGWFSYSRDPGGRFGWMTPGAPHRFRQLPS